MRFFRWLRRLFIADPCRCYYCGRVSRGTCDTCRREVQAFGH